MRLVMQLVKLEWKENVISGAVITLGYRMGTKEWIHNSSNYEGDLFYMQMVWIQRLRNKAWISYFSEITFDQEKVYFFPYVSVIGRIENETSVEEDFSFDCLWAGFLKLWTMDILDQIKFCSVVQSSVP